jgi:hypothetical protein
MKKRVKIGYFFNKRVVEIRKFHKLQLQHICYVQRAALRFSPIENRAISSVGGYKHGVIALLMRYGWNDLFSDQC